MSTRFMIASKYDVDYDGDLNISPNSLIELCNAFEVPINISRDEQDDHIVDIEMDIDNTNTMIRYLCNHPYLYAYSEVIHKCFEEAHLECKENQTEPECLGEYLKDYFKKGCPDKYGFFHLIYL